MLFSNPKTIIPAFPAVLFVLLLLAGLHLPIHAADDNAAAATVDHLHNTLLEIMRSSDDLGYQGRYDELKPVIEASFDLPLIARVIMGRYWNDLQTRQQEEFISVFRRLTIATYANRFDSYEGESFSHIGTEDLHKQRVLVQTQLKKPNGETVSFDYLMHRHDGKWYIISVVAQGVNDLSLKRAEYSAIMEARGFDGLISDLRKKISALEPASDSG